jgi:outer membrane protein
MMRRMCGIVTAALVLCVPGAMSRPDTAAVRGERMVLTLDKAITLALEQNRDVMVAEQERYRSEAQISEAWSGALPQIGISGQYIRNIKPQVLFLPPNNIFNPTDQTEVFTLGASNAYAFGANISQPLYSRKIGVALDIAHLYRDYTDEAFHATTQEVTLAVKRAYYGVLLSAKLVEANRQGLDVVRANCENIRSQYNHGNAAEYDLLRAEVELANTEPGLISAENNLLLARNSLKTLLAIPLETDVDVSGEFSFEEVAPGVLEETRKSALVNNPLVAGLKLRESLLEMKISIERADYFPSLSLFGSYQYQSQDNTFNFNKYLWANSLSVGLQLSYTIFNGFGTDARAEQASIDHQEAHYQRLKAEEGLRLQVQSTELKMVEARKRIEGQQKNIEQAEKAVHIAQTRYRSGVGTQLELLDSQVAMTRAQTNYAQAIYDFLVAKADWTSAVGLAR